MLNEKMTVARGIAKAIGEAERQTDGAMVAGATLLIRVVEGRDTVRGSLALGRDAIAKIVDGMASVARAREQFIAAHEALAGDRDTIGLSPQMSGCSYGSVQPGKGLAVVDAPSAVA